MAEDIDLGKISLTPKGVWNDSVEVEFNDVWSWDGKKYLALQSSKGVIPQEDNIYWFSLSTDNSIHIGAIEDVTDEHLINIDPSGEFVEAVSKADFDEAVNEINSDLNEVKEKAGIINNAGSGEKFLSDNGTYKSMAEVTTEGSIHIGAIEDVADEHLINIDPSGEFVEAVSKADFDEAVNEITASISLLNSSISEIQMQSARKISIYFQQNGLSVSPDGVNGSVSVADCWRPYLIDCSKNKLEDNRLVGELQRNNFLRYVDGSFAPSICITDVQKAECDVELYLDSNATTKYCNAGAFNPVSFYNQYGVNQKLYNISGDEVRVLRPWESTNTDYSIVIATTKDMWFIDNEIGSSGRVWKGVFSNPTTWDGIDATKLSRTGLSPGPSTTIGGKFRNRFFLYNTGDVNTVSSKGREDLFTAFYNHSRSFPRTNDVSQLTAATFARANNYDTSKPYPFSEIGMFAYTCFVSSHEIKHNTKALHDPNIFSSGISSNDRANNYDEFLNYGGVRYSTDGGLTYIYSLWHESKGLYFTSAGNTSFMSEFLNIQWPKEQCMEAQMALSYACELNIPENTEFEFYGEIYYYRNPNGAVSLLDGEMNSRLYKKVNQTISCFDSSGSPITANVECLLRIPIMDGFNICGDVSRYIPGGCEIVGVRNNQAYGTDLPYSVYLETDQTKFIYETAIYKGINETFDFQHIYKKIGNYNGFNGFRKSLAPFTFLGGESGGSILTGECAAIEGRDAWSSSVNQIGRMASKQGSHARLSAIGPRFAYITNAASYAVRNVGSSMQVLL